MDDHYLSPGGIAELVNLSDQPQDVEITVQIKEQLIFKDQYAVSDGVHWVPVFLGRKTLPVETLNVIQITSACYYRTLGFVYVGRATIARDQPPAYIIGNPMELTLELGPDFRSRFPIARLGTTRWNWSEDADLSHPPIRALVTYKSRLEFHESKPPSFMVHLLDETGEIRASASDGVACELYNHFEEGKVYYIHNTSLRTSHQLKLNNLIHRYNLILRRETIAEECYETRDIPVLRFDFMQLDQFDQAPTMTICDVVGVVSYVGHLGFYRTRDGQRIRRRAIKITDQTKNNAPAILWADHSEEFVAPIGTVIAFRNVRVVADDEVRYFSVLSPSTIHIEPQMEEAVALRHWYAQLDSRV